MNERLFEKLSDIADGQKKLAEHLGIAPQTVSAWKSRGTPPPSKYIPQIAVFLNVSVDWLLTGEDRSTSNVVSGPITGIAFMQGANHGTLSIGNGGESRALSAEAVELVRVFEALDFRSRRKVIDLVLELDENKNHEGE